MKDARPLFLTTPRIAAAFAVLMGGAALAIFTLNNLAGFLVIGICGIFALACLMMGEHEAPLPEPGEIERLRAKSLKQGRFDAYQDVIDAMHEPVLIIRNARVAFANSSAKSLLGDHIVGEDVRVAIRHPAAADRLANPDTHHSGEPILLVGVGSANQRWELRLHNLIDGMKLVELSDQSSRYAAERMRTDFVANASHELRTPLAVIKGFVETLHDPSAASDPDTRARFLKIMDDEASHMQRLIEDLMSLSRIEAEKYQLPNNEVDLGVIVSNAKSFFKANRSKKDQDFILDIPGDLPKIYGDEAQLTQLIHNLVSNAFKYGGKSTPVHLQIEPGRSGSMLVMTISDEGDGIDADDIPRLTERFYRVDKGRSKAIGGTGLGLSIVKHITERHGGRMNISSERGKGTSVSIYLPVVSEHVRTVQGV